ncbi:ABC transporter substrate-binding protein [Specibacter cremeus]|uniref:ABC transporter substrate-binding protein n=1 Tax=Specibacter cremeus TaxID=1629051 RepID=UPI0013DE454E|nr:ABC transporter substrate-binding protein [Specibacter cremeus]
MAAGLSILAAIALSGCVVLRPGVAAQVSATQAPTAYKHIIELPQDIKGKGSLVIGSQISSPPLIFFSDGNIAVEGINKDIADEIGRRLGVGITWKQLPFAGLIPAVQSGKVDAGMDLIGDTPQRRAAVDFANYMNQATSPLVRRGNPHNIQSVDDLCGLAVAIVRGGVQLELAEETSAKCTAAGKKPVQIEQFSSPGDARLSVQAGRTAAFLGNTPVMRYISEAAATKAIFQMGGGTTYQLQPIGIITAQSKPALHVSIQSALDMMQADGTIAKILATWHTEDLALKSDLGAAK